VPTSSQSCTQNDLWLNGSEASVASDSRGDDFSPHLPFPTVPWRVLNWLGSTSAGGDMVLLSSLARTSSLVSPSHGTTERALLPHDPREGKQVRAFTMTTGGEK
jgi:hypothetical protein